MMSFVKVAKTTDIPKNKIKAFNVQGKKITIANVDGQFFAIDDICPHAKCSFGKRGFLDGTTVVCGCHGASFDVASGKVLSLPALTDVKSHEVKVEGKEILINI